MKLSMRAIAFDPSNGANYIYIAYIHRYNLGEGTKTIYESAFSTLHHAMMFFNPWGNADKWENNKGIWSLDFIVDNPMDGYKVEIVPLILVVA